MSDLDRLALRRRIAALLAPWAGARPGMTVGIVQGDGLVLHESAGLASLELGVAITAQTCFRVASVSKQFTCAAVLLLAAEGRLDPDDPLGSHLPDLPDPLARVTLDQLMHNSGGVRDMLEIMRQGGADLGLAVDQATLLAAVARQRTLNAVPGTRFVYSNSGFMLLGRVVEAVSGQALAQVLQQRVFAPLGMTRTAHTPDPLAPQPGLATGYLPRGDGFVRAAHGFALGGEGGLVSCVEDLALWARNFTTGRVGGAALTASLQRAQHFPSGVANRYLRGLRADTHRGTPTISHGGLWPGYRTEFLRAPEQDVTIIAITNDGGSDPARLAHQVLEAVIEGRPGIRPPPRLPSRPTLAPLAGTWVREDGATSLDIALDAEGAPVVSLAGAPVTLAAADDGRLATTHGTILLALRPLGPDALEIEQDAGFTALWRRAPASPGLPSDLAGSYLSEEMAARWSIAAAEVTIEGPLLRGVRRPLVAVAPDLLRVVVPGLLRPGWMDVRVRRDAAGSISGLRVQTARLWDVDYAREPPAVP